MTERLGLLTVPSPGPASLQFQGNRSSLRTEGLCCEVLADIGDFRVSLSDGTHLLESTSGGVRFRAGPGHIGGESFLASFALHPDEGIYGFGGRIAPLQRRGHTVDVFAMKVGTHSGDYGGFPRPYFLSSRGYAVFLNKPWPHLYFDMGATVSDQW